MKTFEELSKEIELVLAFSSKKGTMYVPKNEPRPKQLIRHFDGDDFTIDLLPAFVDLIDALLQWIQQYPELKQYIKFEGITEYGEDFIIRPFHIILSNRLLDYDRNVGRKQGYKFPKPLKQIRAIIEEYLKKMSTPKEEILAAVLRKSIIESAKKTIYDIRYNELIIIEPSIKKEDLVNWKKVTL